MKLADKLANFLSGSAKKMADIDKTWIGNQPVPAELKK